MTTRNNNIETSHKSIQAAQGTVEDTAVRSRKDLQPQRGGKSECKPHAEAQMRRRAEELRALLRDLD